MRNRQRGASFLFIMFMIAVIGYTGYMGLKLIPVYLDYNSIRTSIDSIAAEMQSRNMSKSQVRDALTRRLDVNYISLNKLKPIDKDCKQSKSDILIYENKRNETNIGVAYNTEVKLFGNLSASMDFTYVKNVASGKSQ